MRRLVYAGAAVALAAAGAASAPLAAGLAEDPKVLICHVEPQPTGGALKIEMLVAEDGVEGHLLHGDTRGGCFVETVTVTSPAETVTLPGTTTTLPGETTTVTLPGTTTTLPGETTTTTLPGTTTTLPGETTTITLPSATTTVTVPGETSTVTVPGATTTMTLPGETTTVTVPGPTNTVTVPGSTNTVTVPGPTNTVTLAGPATTVTTAGQTVTQPGVTTTAAGPATSGGERPSSRPPVGCPQLVVSARTIPVGRASAVAVRVRRGSTPVEARLALRGAGVATTVRTGANGVARVSVRPSRAGIVEIHVVGQPTRCSRRIGVVGIFRPPNLTG